MKDRQSYDHFLSRTVTYRVKIDRADPASIALAHARLEDIPGDVEGVETEVGAAKFAKQAR